MKINRKTRRQIDAVVASMSPADRRAYKAMAAEDEALLFECLVTQVRGGGVFDLPGIQKHFRLARLLLGMTEC